MKILFLDDDSSFHCYVENVMSMEFPGIEYKSCFTETEAHEELEKTHWDYFFCDHFLVKTNGLEFIRDHKELLSNTTVYMQTAVSEKVINEFALKYGVVISGVLNKSYLSRNLSLILKKEAQLG